MSDPDHPRTDAVPPGAASPHPGLTALAHWATENGYAAATLLPDGRVAFVVPTFGGAQIGVGGMSTAEGVSERFSYESLFGTFVALVAWAQIDGFAGEPSGWIRHQPSNRRRRYADDGSFEEYVAP